MKQPTEINETFSLAADIIRNTSQSVFLTGKAGTGKTTFLHYIRTNVDKNVIVAAPTGVAAINAGGVTLHSLLQLPFEPFIPNAEGRKKLDYHFKLRKSKIEMLRELELLVIDEVSMLRADMVDAIDHMLRRYRGIQEPFGGVQLLFIGDMFQLPPVVQQHEWNELKQHYPSPFFFHAQVLNGNLPLYIELKKIYRQSDQHFIDILNRIRNNQVTTEDLKTLNARYNPAFEFPKDKKYIVLCTHNYKTDRINNNELVKLKTSEIRFKGQVKGDFLDNALPTEKDLVLKVGAQIMFIKNDVGERRRYYNGKLGIITHLTSEKIFVQFEDLSEIDLERETWRNVRYTLNKDSGEIEEEELGSFTQYPIRLAWAITIHKSQGLTLEHVVIDAGEAFAGGQVYVALSRCTSLDGIVLSSPITAKSIQTDEGAIAFAREEKSLDYLTKILNEEKPRYCAEQLKKTFDWTPVVRCLRSFYELVSEKKIPKQEQVREMASQLCDKAAAQDEIARNFRRELDSILFTANPSIDRLKDRVQKAVLYFHKDMNENIVQPLQLHLESLKNASKVKAYLKGVQEIYTTLLNLLSKLEHVHYGNIDLTEELIFEKKELPQQAETVEPDKKEKAQKGDSQRLTLSLFNEGKTVKEIVKERNLTTTTIEGHLTGFILSGEISIEKLIPENKIAYLMSVVEEAPQPISLSAIKESLPKEYTYLDIKAVINHLKWLKEKNSN